MRGSSMKSREPGAPAGKLGPSRYSREARRVTLCLPMGLITISKRQTWQIILAIIPLFAHAAAGHSNGSSVASFRAPLDASLGSSDSWPPQSSTTGWEKTKEDLRNYSVDGLPRLHTTRKELYTQSVLLNTVRTEASGNVELKAGGEELLGTVSPGLQIDQNSSSIPDPATLAETTGVSPKGFSKEFKQPDSMSPVGTVSLGTADTEMKFLRSSSAMVAYGPLATMVHPSIDVLSGSPPTQFSDASSRMTRSEWTTVNNGQEHGGIEPAGRGPLTGTAIPATLSQSSVWPSLSPSAVAPAQVTPLASLTSMDFVTSSSDQPSMVESTIPESQSSLAASEWPSRNATSPATSHSSKAEFPADVASNNFIRLTSSHLPLPTLHSGDTAIGYSAPVLQTGSSEAMTNTESYGTKEETPAAARVIPIFSSELPSTASGATPPVKMDASSILTDPEAHLAGKQTVLPRKSSATLPPPPNSTLLAMTWVTLMSKGSSEQETLTMSDATNDAIVHTLAAGTDSMLPSLPSLDSEGVTLPIGATSAGMAHADMLTAGPMAGTTMELSMVTPSQWKHAISTPAIPTPTHGAASLASRTEQGRSSVVPTHGAVSTSFASFGSSWASVPGATLKIYIKATEGQMAREEQEGPTSTVLSGASSAEAWRPHLKTTAMSLSVASTTFRIAPLLPTRVLEVDLNNSATTALLTSPRILPSESKSTAGTVCSRSPCITTSNISASFVPSQTKLALLPASSRPLWARKGSVTTLGPTNAKEDSDAAVLHPRGTSPQETDTTLLMRAKSVTVTQGDRVTKQLGLTFKAPILSRSTRKEDWILSRPTSPLTMVHILPLWFRLIKIDYTESLENKSSESYKKLEREVKLLLNKMLAAYEAFLQTDIHRFLNGSVMVESEAVFQAQGLVPSSSDVIRTIVTEVEIKKMDTFFDWRVDVQSLWSNGFSLKNLEPEKLAVSFTVLGVGPRSTFGGMINWEHLENLRSQVIMLLGARYAVQNISLAEVGNTHRGIDINGTVYINTNTHVDIGWALKALMGLLNYSVDLTSLSINGSKLSLQVFPVSFLVTNRVFDERMMDRSSAEHQHITRDLSETLMHILGKYKSLLQVAIREITGGSLVCHGDAIFRHPAPTSQDVLQTLSLSVGPNDYLDSSSLQVDPFSFTVAGDGLEPPFPNPGFPGYGIGIIVLCALVLIVFSILALMPKILGRKDKIIINRVHDPEAGVETFELDNPGFRTTMEEDDDGHSRTPTEAVG